MLKWLFGKQATTQPSVSHSQTEAAASAPESAPSKTVVSLIRETILASQEDLEGTEGLELIDALRNIYNTGFSNEAVRQGREHRNPKVRKYVDRFLRAAAELRS